jgi:hypothetical protein
VTDLEGSPLGPARRKHRPAWGPVPASASYGQLGRLGLSASQGWRRLDAPLPTLHMSRRSLLAAETN